jgi:2-iminobutanoate/2-iminopropanoate deaminase
MPALKKEIIIPAGGSKPLAPYSPGTKFGQFIFTAGQVGIDPTTGKLAEGGVKAETKQALENLKSILEAAGSDLNHVMKTTVFLNDINDYAAVNEVYGQYFTDDPPARSALQVGKLPLGADVEIEAIAVAKQG